MFNPPSRSTFDRLVKKRLLEQNEEEERERAHNAEQDVDEILAEFSSPESTIDVGEQNPAVSPMEQAASSVTSESQNALSSTRSSNSSEKLDDTRSDQDARKYATVGDARYALDDDINDGVSSSDSDDLYGLISDESDLSDDEKSSSDSGESQSDPSTSTSGKSNPSVDRNSPIEAPEVRHERAEENADDADRVRNGFAAIALKHRMKHVVIKDILKYLREIGHDVCEDPRTLLGTTRDTSDESFEHFGLIKGIARKIRNGGVEKDIHRLNLVINIDGLPLYRSSKVSFWPILGRLTNCNDSSPFVISVFSGISKPPDLEEYLQPFLDEMLQLEQRSLCVDGRSFHVVLRCAICDAPARCFVKVIKGHGGVFGCERCVQRGSKKGGMTFPALDSKLRDGLSFRRQTNKQHHRGFSPFLELNIDMVFGFPLDYMHLVCLGVMKRLLSVWRGKHANRAAKGIRKPRKPNEDYKAQDRANRISNDDQEIINDRISRAAKRFPKEFQRKGRSLEDLEMWKAVELRNFLLYSGPVVLYGVLDDAKYEHYLYFHVGIRILCSVSATDAQIDFADRCLKYFVYQFGEIYGCHHLVYNVHSLSHLATERKKHCSPLDSFSAFPFENYLGRMKALLRGTRRPLAQLKKRLSELERHENFTSLTTVFDSYSFNIDSIIPNSRSDSFLMETDARRVLYVTAISECHIFGIELNLSIEGTQLTPFFEVPLKSTLLKIHVADPEFMDNDTIVSIPLTKISTFVKCIAFVETDDGNLVIFPLLHNL